MTEYMDNYGVSFQLPSIYVQASKMFPKDPRYNLQLINFAFPESDEFEVAIHNLDGSHERSTFTKINAHLTNGLVLRILVREENNLKQVDEVSLFKNHALISFNQDGSLFAIFYPETQIIKILQFETILGFIQQIKDCESGKKEYMINHDGTEQDLSFIENIEFDQNKRFFIGYGKQSIFIINLESKLAKVFQINTRLYSEVRDVSFISKDDHDFECYIACRRKKFNQICIFDFHEDITFRVENGTMNHGKTLLSQAILNFDRNIPEEYQVKISHDFNQVVFACADFENSIVNRKMGYYTQVKLKALQNRQVRYIIRDYENGGFYLLVFEQFDKFITVQHTNKPINGISISRSIEPDIIKIFDFHICDVVEWKTTKSQAVQKEIRIISLKDMEYMLDKVVFEEVLEDNPMFLQNEAIHEINMNIPKKIAVQSKIEFYNYIFSPLRACSIAWPYITISGLGNIILIMNAFEKRVVRRVQVAQKSQQILISETFLTETKDLFIVIQDQNIYRLYMLDLDESNEHELNDGFDPSQLYRLYPLFTYTEEQVHLRPLKQIHIRGSSRKEPIDLNQQLQAFFLHGEHIYTWSQVNQSKDLSYVCSCNSRMQPISDHEFYFQNIDKAAGIQDIIQMKIVFITYEKQIVFQETSSVEELRNFNIDSMYNKLIIFSKTKAGRGSSQKFLSTIKVFDLVNQEIDYEGVIHDKGLIGRLESGMYVFAAGHYYYNNNVIKIRYDLILNNKNIQYEAEDILNVYQNCFMLQQNERVRTDTPLNSYQSHKLAYIITDKLMKNPMRVLVVPYLHDRRIYLNRLKPSIEYFYTTVETSYASEKKYHEAVAKALANGDQASSVNIIETITPKPVDPNSLKSSIFKAQKSQRSLLKQDAFTTIVCVNLTSLKLYMYSQSGILINRVEFLPLVETYGDPLQVSNNGQMFIFKKTFEQLDIMAEQGNIKRKLLQRYFTVSIIKLTVFGMQHVKDVNFIDQIEEYLYLKGGKKMVDEFYFKNQWLMETTFERAQKEVEFDFLVNDRGDLCVRIRNIQDFETEETGVMTNHLTIYYFERFDKLKGSKSQDVEQVSGLYTTNKHRNTKFIFTRKYLFFWDAKCINFFYLENEFFDKNLNRVGFKIDPNDPKSRIDDIRTGSIPMYICIIVTNSQDSDNVIIWNMDHDIEGESYEIEEDYIVVWDIKGKPYIFTEKKAIFPEQRCAVTAFDYEGAIKRFNARKSRLSVHKGHRVDGKNHNWLVFDEYISLSFSYMSFVIKDKIEKECPNLGKHFDPEPYNYIYNRSTSFIDGNFVSNDHTQLNYVLEELEKIDPNSLEIINYTNEVFNVCQQSCINSALHKAVLDGNQRSIDILLSFMSKISTDSSKNYMSIFSQLIDQLKFIDYFTNLLQRSNAMVKKQVIRANGTYNEKIVEMASSSSIYVDQLFFTDEMNDTQKQVRSYPVTILSLSVGWYMNEPEGKVFLKEILMTPNMDIYKIESLQVIIEYLFMKYKGIIFVLVLPLYVLLFVFYQLLMFSLGKYFEQLVLKRDLIDNSIEDAEHNLMIWEILFGISLFLLAAQILNSIYQQGSRYFGNVYSIVDLIFMIQSFYLYAQIYILVSTAATISDFDIEQIIKSCRYIQIIGIMALYMKGSYFLSLIDEIAPLIDIIKQIFYDIRYFMLVLVFYGVMMANCFDYLSRNQLDFDNISNAERDLITYNGTFNSLIYVVQIMLGNTDASAFNLGDGSQYYVLLAFFVFSCFTIILHFMNMLIAIMGQTFADRREVGAQVMVKDHLRFVMDNWLLMNIAFMDKKRIKYIITAFQANDQDQDTELPIIKEMLMEIKEDIKDEFQRNRYQSRETHIIANDILKKVK